MPLLWLLWPFRTAFSIFPIRFVTLVTLVTLATDISVVVVRVCEISWHGRLAWPSQGAPNRFEARDQEGQHAERAEHGKDSDKFVE